MTEHTDVIAALREQNGLLVMLLADQRAERSRLMTGYEGAHRRVADLCDTLAQRLSASEATTTRALTMQVELAEEREELLSRKQSRDLEAAAAKAKQEVFVDLAREVKALGLLFAKSKMGIPLTGNDSHGLQDFLSTLDERQLSDFFEKGEMKFSMAQRQLLGAVFMSLAGKKEAPELAPENADTNAEHEATNHEIAGAAMASQNAEAP